MFNKNNFIYMVVFITLLILLSCNPTENKKNTAVNNGKDSIITNIKEVEKIIDLRKVKVDMNSSINMCLYKIGIDNEKLPGPSDYYLIATFKVLNIDTSKLKVINTMKTSLDTNTIYYKEWLPNNVVKTLFTKETFKEIKVYSAELFYKSPYLQGFFILQSDSTIFMQLHTK